MATISMTHVQDATEIVQLLLDNGSSVNHMPLRQRYQCTIVALSQYQRIADMMEILMLCNCSRKMAAKSMSLQDDGAEAAGKHKCMKRREA